MVNGNSPWGRIGVVLEKYGMSYDFYMHGTNFVNIDMMLADTPRMLTEEEKKIKKKKDTTFSVRDLFNKNKR